ncbi:FkbM family methyltransferase [Rhodocytophaga rosea]|uniref:FkbM family methyltransferase n=1 Tax=Rhodocytophaga rosea TaxID=2704465 RepID=A0A6C0GR51_9BACT|nr:FkbM family methyltransferase [Rhodocytophaga rosea]QHT70546.1 FkbM family methyltransferase [Rhodocytophaga rosea]
MNLRYNPIGDNGEKWLINKVYQYYSKKKITPIIFDVGANIGEYSAALLQTFRKNIQLYSFEPSLRTFKLLQNNSLLAHSTINLYNIGFSHEKTKARFSYNIHDPATSSLYSLTNNNDTIIEEVELTTIDDFCFLHHISHIHFIKVDVEGNEVNVLKGASQIISSNKIDFIQFEFGPRNVDSRTFLKDFYIVLEAKFNIYRILRNGLYPLNPYHQDYEAFLAGNYLAINKRISLAELVE